MTINALESGQTEERRLRSGGSAYEASSLWATVCGCEMEACAARAHEIEAIGFHALRAKLTFCALFSIRRATEQLAQFCQAKHK